MSKKLLSLPILLLLTLSAFSALNVGITGVSAVVSPYIKVDPESTVNPALTPGENYTISIITDYAGDDVWGYEFTLTYNPLVLQGVEVVNGSLITGTYAEFAAGTFDNDNGELSLTGNSLVDPITRQLYVTNGPGILANVTFTVVGIGDSAITLGPETRLIGAIPGTGEKYTIIDEVLTPDQVQDGYFANKVDVVHDTAVTSGTVSPTSLYQGRNVTITNVNVGNEGNVEERFDVSVYHGIIHPNWLIHNETVQLSAGGSTTLSDLVWDTTGETPGTWDIIVVVSEGFNETDTADNTRILDSVHVRFIGDIDGDADVDGDDFVLFAGVYPSDPAANPEADLEFDGDVDGDDFVIFAGNYPRREQQ